MGKALIIKGADFSAVAVDTIDIEVIQPTISYTIAGQITLSQSSGDDIYYTTDGSTPTTASTKYTAPFTVQPNTTVKAVAYNGSNYSDVASFYFDGSIQAPVISITKRGVVSITAATGATIYYTTDGSTPTTASTQYSEPFSVQDGVVVKAIAAAGSITSSVASATAEVEEPNLYGKKMSNTGAMSDNAEWLVSRKIPIAGGSSFTWTYTGATSNETIVVEFNSSNQKTEYWNINVYGYSGQTASRTITAKANTSYLRVTQKIGTDYIPSNVVSGGETLWEYNGESE